MDIDKNDEAVEQIEGLSDDSLGQTKSEKNANPSLFLDPSRSFLWMVLFALLHE